MWLLNPPSPVRRHVWIAFLLLLSIGPNARAANIAMRRMDSSQGLAFARYLASQEQHDPFAGSAPVAVLIEASLPDLYKSAAEIAVQSPGEDERPEFQVVQVLGDGTVAAEVVGRYFTLRRQIDNLPRSSVAVTPDNYKFRFRDEVTTGGSAAYVYDITPKKKRPGLLSGQLWMDSDTGQEVMLAGHLMKMSAVRSRIDVVRDTPMADGPAFARTTHVAFALPRLGRADLTITEFVLRPAMTAPRSGLRARTEPERSCWGPEIRPRTDFDAAVTHHLGTKTLAKTRRTVLGFGSRIGRNSPVCIPSPAGMGSEAMPQAALAQGFPDGGPRITGRTDP